MFHIKHERSLDFLDGTPESPQVHCHKSRGTLRSLQKHKRAPCTPNQLKMKPDSLGLTQEEYQVPQVPQEEDSLSYRYVRGTLSLWPQVEWTQMP